MDVTEQQNLTQNCATAKKREHANRYLSALPIVSTSSRRPRSASRTTASVSGLAYTSLMQRYERCKMQRYERC
jgi:hypothetical protein